MFARRHAARARKYRAIDVHRLFQRYKCRTWTVEPAQQEPWPQDSAQLWIAKVQARRVAKAALHHGPQQHLCGTRDHRVHGVLCGEKGGGQGGRAGVRDALWRGVWKCWRGGSGFRPPQAAPPFCMQALNHDSVPRRLRYCRCKATHLSWTA